MRTAITMLSLAGVLAGCASPGLEVQHLRDGQTGWITYPSSKEPIRLRGHLVIPASADQPAPAMIIVHASGGLDARNARWAQFLQEHGIATFQIDYFGPRGVAHDSSVQPTPVQDVLDALRLLATHPKIDPKRVGVIGFSRGGQLALMALQTGPDRKGGQELAAYVSLYGPCFSLVPGGKVFGGPALVLAGELDDLVSVPLCEERISRARAEGHDITLKVYAGAHHGWDGDHDGVWFHRAINQSYMLQTSAEITARSRQDVLDFLRRALRL